MGNVYLDILLALHEIRRRRIFALAVAAALCLFCWIGILIIPNRYQSEARIYVQVENFLPEKIGVSVASRQRQIGQLKRTLTSTIVIERLIRDPEIARIMPRNVKTVDAIIDLRRTIEVIEQQENLFRISARIGFRQLDDTQNAQLARLSNIALPMCLSEAFCPVDWIARRLQRICCAPRTMFVQPIVSRLKVGRLRGNLHGI